MASPIQSLLIESYGDGGFRVRGAFHTGSCLLLPDGLSAWAAVRVEDATAESLEPVRATARGIDLLLVGTGDRMQPLPPSAARRLAEFGVAVEIMSTGAACRTYNVLQAEGRRVAAALIAVT